MTEAEERDEIIRNARAARKAKEISEEQLHDVYYIQATVMAEKELNYPEAKQ